MSNFGEWKTMSHEDYIDLLARDELLKFCHTFDGCQRSEFKSGIVVIHMNDKFFGAQYFFKDTSRSGVRIATDSSDRHQTDGNPFPHSGAF